MQKEGYESGKAAGSFVPVLSLGEVSEEVHWEMNSREGPWIQYFEGGSPQAESQLP